jgi:integration host factor subunit alpha
MSNNLEGEYHDYRSRQVLDKFLCSYYEFKSRRIPPVSKTVTRATLTKSAATATGLAHPEVADIGQRMFELIGNALMNEESVKLTGFGTLQVRDRAERIGRNPRTGQEHAIVPHKTVVFIQGAKIRAALDRAAKAGTLKSDD